MNGIDGWIPPEVQLGASAIIALILIAGAVAKYFRDVRQANDAVSEKPALQNLQILGAALNEAKSLGDIAASMKEISQSLKEIRAIYDRSTERSIQRHDEHMDVLKQIAEGPRPRRRST